jgi:hypothetical protein
LTELEQLRRSLAEPAGAGSSARHRAMQTAGMDMGSKKDPGGTGGMEGMEGMEGMAVGALEEHKMRETHISLFFFRPDGAPLVVVLAAWTVGSWAGYTATLLALLLWAALHEWVSRRGSTVDRPPRVGTLPAEPEAAVPAPGGRRG